MNVKFDFTLSRNFGVVSQAVFRLVLCGVHDVKTITNLLRIYSNDVLANAIRKLVNSQILTANLSVGTLCLSDSAMALIKKCHDSEFDITLPDNIIRYADGNKIVLHDDGGDLALRETFHSIKIGVIALLLPGTKIGFLANYIDIIIIKED